MSRLQAKSFDDADEVRNLPRAFARVVNLDETTVGLATWEPGWHWKEDLAALAGTASCQFLHLGYALSGRLEVVTDDGQRLEIVGGSVFEIPPGHDAWVVGDEPFVTVEWTSSRTVGRAPEGPGERVLATILFTDIVGSTATLARVGDAAWRDLLLAHNARLRQQLNEFRGREIAGTGDGVLALFDGATRAVRCGVAMARAAEQLGLEIRVGVHTGEVEIIGGNARGVAVHAAARIMSAAGPGEVLVSSTTRDLLEGSGVDLEARPPQELKGLAGARALYRVGTTAGAGAGSRGELLDS
ncbi:MAG TPA: adenylate/guanylate cyclase domain-containing protein [Candidatus Limnocylindrales bacterium]|nr:adenylate/guanylate cyclase domain-containing protein [Candidatus Limnocylindrales bacterium]